jgi:hypothetical protein
VGFPGAAGANAASLVPPGISLAAVHDWTFLSGPNFALGPNALLLAYLMYRSRLVPRFIAMVGLVGGPLPFAWATAMLFGLYEQVSTWAAIAAVCGPLTWSWRGVSSGVGCPRLACRTEKWLLGALREGVEPPCP